MKKFEKLNNSLFENFKENKINQMHKLIGGGTIATCHDNCQDTRSYDPATDTPDERISISTTDC